MTGEIQRVSDKAESWQRRQERLKGREERLPALGHWRPTCSRKMIGDKKGLQNAGKRRACIKTQSRCWPIESREPTIRLRVAQTGEKRACMEARAGQQRAEGLQKAESCKTGNSKPIITNM